MSGLLKRLVGSVIGELGLSKPISLFKKLFGTTEITKNIGITPTEIFRINNKIDTIIRKGRENFVQKHEVTKQIETMKRGARTQVAFFDSWITMARKLNGKWDLKMSGKWYSFPTMFDGLISRMKMSKYVGKLLWNTLWLHKRKWTTGTKKKKSLFNSDLEARDYKQLSKYIVKTKKIPKGYNASVQSSAKWGRLTTSTNRLFEKTIWK